jgi:hypothetical protein
LLIITHSTFLIITVLDYNLTDKMIPGLAIDIDETLSWTIGYWVGTMQKLFGNPENLSQNQLIAKYRYTQNVPYWQTKEAEAWMEEQRFSNELQTKLPLIDGANTYLTKISKIIPISAYTTTRPDKVKDGTQKWLEQNNFPKAEIICRPSELPFNKGDEWKAKFIKENNSRFIGVIDDKPQIAELLGEEYNGTIFLYEHANVNNQSNVISCKDWKTIYEKVKEM